MTEHVHLKLLGVPRLVLDGGRVHELERHDAALLALLARDGPTPRARIVSMLWPDASEQTARTNLRQRLFRLRKRIGVPLVVSEPILALHDGAGHDLEPSSIDSVDLAGSDADAQSHQLLGAFDYSDFEQLGEWVSAARESLRTRRCQMLASRAAELEAQGRVAQALECAERLTVLEPTAEHAHRRVMRLHYRRGDRAAAMAAFERCRQALARVLGTRAGDETRELAALIERSGALPASAIRPSPVAMLRPPRLVGRDAEWTLLEHHLARGDVVIVEGEAGIGKSRLLNDFADAHGASIVVNALAGDALLPYALLSRCVRELLRRLGPPPASPWVGDELRCIAPELGSASSTIAPLRLTQAVTEALDAWRTSGLSLVVIDDLQYADAASLELLPAIATASGRSGLCWLVASRTAGLPSVATAALGALGAHARRRLALAPLDAPSLEHLLESLDIAGLDAAAWTPTLAQRTGGNPMFVLETLISLHDEGPAALSSVRAQLPTPASVGELIGHRISQLSPEAQRLARVAALAGQDFDAHVASAVLGQHLLDVADTWCELESALIMVDGRFAHDLLREGALRSIPEPVAAALHGELAVVLAARGAAPPARIASHWFEAGIWDRAGAAYSEAAKRAFDASRDAEAERWFELAAECFARSQSPDEQRLALQESITCKMRRHDIVGARKAAQLLPGLAGTNPESRAWALERLCEVATIARDDALALDSARRALAAAPDSDNRWIEFNCTRKLCLAMAHAGRFDESLAHIETQQAWQKAHSHEWNAHVWLTSHAYVLHRADRHLEAVSVYEQAREIAGRHANWHSVYAVARDLAQERYWRGDLCGALRESSGVQALRDRLDVDLAIRNPRDASGRAMLLRSAGAHAESLALLEASVAILTAGDSPFWLSFCEDQLALGYLAVGQIARAHALVKSAVRCDNVEAHAMRWLVRSRCSRAQGRLDDTPAPLPSLFERPECPNRLRLLAALEAGHSKPTHEAWPHCEEIAQRARRGGLDGIAVHAQILAGSAAVHAGAAVEGEAIARAALSALRDEGVDPTGLSHAAALWICARSFAQLGQAALSATLAREAAVRLRQVELPQVPAPFRDSFLSRNPMHRQILAAQARHAPF